MSALWRKKEDRFYTISELGGRELVSVTTFLNVIAKPALAPWYAREERKLVLRSAQVCVDSTIPHDLFMEELVKEVGEQRAGDIQKHKAAKLGKKSHSAIEAALRGDTLPIMEPAELKIFQGWWGWWKRTGFHVVLVEKVVWHAGLEFAGTFDVLAKHPAHGFVLIDWKTSKNVWPEHFLQNRAYRMAAHDRGIESNLGAVIKLKKSGGDPEVWPVNDELHTEQAVAAAAALWQWNFSVRKKYDG